MNAFATAIATKKLITGGIVAAAIVGGGVSAESSGLMASITGRSNVDAQVSATAMLDTTIEALTNLSGTILGGGAVQTGTTANLDASAAAGVAATANLGTDATVPSSVSLNIGTAADTQAEGSTVADAGTNTGGRATGEAKAEATANLSAPFDLAASATGTGLLGVSIR